MSDGVLPLNSKVGYSVKQTQYDPRRQFPSPLDNERLAKLKKCAQDNTRSLVTQRMKLKRRIAEAILAGAVGETVQTVGAAWDRVAWVLRGEEPRFDAKHPENAALRNEFMQAAEAVIEVMK